MNHQAYAIINSSQESGVLYDAYTHAHQQYYVHKMLLAESRMKLAFHDQRLAGVIMQKTPVDHVNMSTRITWAHSQRRAFQVIEECRAIIAECKRHIRSAAPSFVLSDN
jgi:hypothetical protein